MVLASFQPSPAPFVVLMGLGFLIGTVGHVYKSRIMVATGIGLILVATLLLPLALYAADCALMRARVSANRTAS